MADTEVFLAMHAEEDERVLADVMRRFLNGGSLNLTSWSGQSYVQAEMHSWVRLSQSELEVLQRARNMY